MVGSTQRVAVARARAPRDEAVQHCLEYLGFYHQDFELEESARSVVQFEGVLPEAVPCVAYAPINLDGQVGIVVDAPPEAYKLVRLVVHLARCLYAATIQQQTIPTVVTEYCVLLVGKDRCEFLSSDPRGNQKRQHPLLELPP